MMKKLLMILTILLFALPCWGATGCVINDDSIPGTLDLDETVTVKNTWVTTVDLAGIGAAETATFNSCAFAQSEAAIDATLGGGATSYDAGCQFSINTTDCFIDYAGANYTLKSTSPLINKGTETGDGNQVDLAGNNLLGAMDIGAYEYQQPENALWFNNVTGNDSNTSISSSVPLLTFDHLSRLGLADGCTIYLRGGQTWADTFDAPSPGFLGGVITLKSYGSGGPAILTGIPNFDEEFWQVEGIEFR